ncbi:hypothetical protein DDW12_08545, partial [Sulfolobus islandicus]
GASLTSLKEFQKKGLFKYKGLSIPAGEAFRPLNPFFVKIFTIMFKKFLCYSHPLHRGLQM